MIYFASLQPVNFFGTFFDVPHLKLFILLEPMKIVECDKNNKPQIFINR